MSADKDKWLEELRHKFDNYEEPASENLWKSIERDVNAIDIKRRIRRNVVRIASIAACLALITGSYILLHNDGQLPETSLQPAQQIASTTIPSGSNQEYSATEKAMEEKHIATAERRENARTCKIAPAGKSTDKQAYSISTTATEPEEAQKNGQDRKGNARTSTATAHTSNNNTPIIGKYAQNGRVNDKQTGKRKFGVSVKVDNGFFAQNSSNGGFMPMDRQERPIFGPLYSSTKDEAEFNSSYAEMVASNTERPTRTDLQYDIPITASAAHRRIVAFRLRKPLLQVKTKSLFHRHSRQHQFHHIRQPLFLNICLSRRKRGEMCRRKYKHVARGRIGELQSKQERGFAGAPVAILNIGRRRIAIQYHPAIQPVCRTESRILFRHGKRHSAAQGQHASIQPERRHALQLLNSIEKNALLITSFK